MSRSVRNLPSPLIINSEQNLPFVTTLGVYSAVCITVSIWILLTIVICLKMQPCRLLCCPVPDFLFYYIVYQLFFVCSAFVVIHYVFSLLIGYYVSEQMKLLSMHTTCCHILWLRPKENRKLEYELSENLS